MSEQHEENGWGEHKLLVLQNQKELKEGLADVLAAVHALELEIAGFKGRIGAWAAVFGLVGGAIAAAVARRFFG